MSQGHPVEVQQHIANLNDYIENTPTEVGGLLSGGAHGPRGVRQKSVGLERARL